MGVRGQKKKTSPCWGSSTCQVLYGNCLINSHSSWHSIQICTVQILLSHSLSQIKQNSCPTLSSKLCKKCKKAWLWIWVCPVIVTLSDLSGPLSLPVFHLSSLFFSRGTDSSKIRSRYSCPSVSRFGFSLSQFCFSLTLDPVGHGASTAKSIVKQLN